MDGVHQNQQCKNFKLFWIFIYGMSRIVTETEETERNEEELNIAIIFSEMN